MSPYREPAPLRQSVCRHVWRTDVTHFYFDDPVVRARCSRCAVIGSEWRNRWHEAMWLLPRWLLLIVTPQLAVGALTMAAVVGLFWIAESVFGP